MTADNATSEKAEPSIPSPSKEQIQSLKKELPPPVSGSSTSLKNFKQMALLGEGAYSAVYKILRLSDNKIYALKKVKLPTLSEKEKQNSLNEVRLLASVQHENVIGYKEAFYDDPSRCLCIITEYADGGDLFQKISHHQKMRTFFREADVWHCSFGMCHGLKALHELKILHRDLKCANVFLGSKGEVKLGDFNVSKVAKRGLCMTQTGTPYYASPEVWRDMPYDAKSDMWSLGCVIYEMVALRPPFRADDMESLYRKILRGQYPRVPSVYSRDVNEIIALLLQVNPRHRPAVDVLLQLPVMQRHCHYDSASRKGGPKAVCSDLLSTIKMPKEANMGDLHSIIPRPRYEDAIPEESDFESVSTSRKTQESLRENSKTKGVTSQQSTNHSLSYSNHSSSSHHLNPSNNYDGGPNQRAGAQHGSRDPGGHHQERHHGGGHGSAHGHHGSHHHGGGHGSAHGHHGHGGPSHSGHARDHHGHSNIPGPSQIGNSHGSSRGSGGQRQGSPKRQHGGDALDSYVAKKNYNGDGHYGPRMGGGGYHHNAPHGNGNGNGGSHGNGHGGNSYMGSGRGHEGRSSGVSGRTPGRYDGGGGHHGKYDGGGGGHEYRQPANINYSKGADQGSYIRHQYAQHKLSRAMNPVQPRSNIGGGGGHAYSGAKASSRVRQQQARIPRMQIGGGGDAYGRPGLGGPMRVY